MRSPRLPPGHLLELPSGRTTFARIDGPPDAPAVLLLHGWAVTADLNWYGMYDQLPDLRLLAPDHPGHGRAARLRHSGRFTLRRAADDAVGVLDVAGVDRAIVVGYSMGGAVAQLVARHHPSRVAGVVLCATACRFSSRAVATSAGALTLGAALHRRLPPRAALRAFSAVARHRTARWGLTGWPAQEVQRGDATSILEAMAELARFDSRRWLSSVTVPSSVVVTTADTLVTPARQRELVAHRPGASVFEVDGDHVVCTAAPELFGPVLRRAVDAVAVASSRGEGGPGGATGARRRTASGRPGRPRP